MSDLPSFYTQAGNFLSAIEGAVDPRTGMYNVSLQLGEVLGNNGLGPAFPVVLSYSPLATLNGPATTVFGEGISLGLSLYDASSAPCRLLLSTGEQYIVDDDIVRIRQNKLDHVRFEKFPDCYKITYRSGDVEILTGPDDESLLKVPKQLISHLGHSLYFYWNMDGLAPSLNYIKDDAGVTLLNIDYSDLGAPILSFFPGHPENYDIVLDLDSGYLKSVTNRSLGKSNPLIWTFNYDRVGPDGHWGTWLVGMTGPGGGTETAQYYGDGRGARFPDSSIPALPQVYAYMRDPGCHQPPIVCQYDYLGGSFLGDGTDGGSDSSDDALYGVFDDYQYGSDETRTCDGNSIVTSQTYNRYHLLTDKTVSQNGYVRTVHNDYDNLQGGLDFAHQLPNCQCPSKATVKWSSSDGQQQEATVTKYDEQGNLVESMRLDEVGKQVTQKTTWEYYTGDGSESGCPKDPYGFVRRFVKSVITAPYSTSYSDVPTLTTNYTYATY